MSVESVEHRKREFNAHVWDHASDVFQTSFDLRPPLTDDDLEGLSALVEAVGDGGSDEELAALLRELITRRPTFLKVFLQVTGLTRSKPISDLKPPLAVLGHKTPSSVDRFPAVPAVWRLAGIYFAKRARTVFSSLLSVDDDALPGALEALSQATWPGYIRQERAKRSGGYAEQRIAILFQSLDLPFEPEKKAESGLTSDATFEGESFDLVVPNARAPRLCIMCMAHAANIGQYGESKADDARRAKDVLAAAPGKPLLGVFADGVGFDSNRAGLEGVLTNADEFFQFQTLWKAGVVAASVVGRKMHLVLSDADQHRAFLDRHNATVTLVSEADASPGWVEAGEGLMRPS